MAIALVATDSLGFGVTGAGVVYSFPPGAPAAGDLDVLCVNSDALISTPAGWTLRRSEINNQGAYIFSNLGGAGASVTISSPSGAGPFNATLFWSRWSGTNALDVATGAQASTNGTTTPAISTGALAETGELVVAFGALHSTGLATQNTPIWSAGYTGAEFVLQGSGATGVVAAGGYKLNAGLLAETPAMTWSGADATDRYILIATFTALAPPATGTVIPDGISLPVTFGAPTLTDSTASIAPDSLTIPLTFGSPTISGATTPPPLVTINLGIPNFVSVVTGVGACIIDALDQTPAGAPCRQCLLLPTQQIPWDNCGPCDDDSCSGQVALAIRSVYGSDTFPAPAGKTWAKCTPRWWVARVVVSVTRCVPTMDELGAPPTCAQELAAAVTLEWDRAAVRQAIACCLADAYATAPYRVGAWFLDASTTVGELGGCAGSETEFVVGVQACSCPG